MKISIKIILQKDDEKTVSIQGKIGLKSRDGYGALAVTQLSNCSAHFNNCTMLPSSTARLHRPNRELRAYEPGSLGLWISTWTLANCVNSRLIVGLSTDECRMPQRFTGALLSQEMLRLPWVCNRSTYMAYCAALARMNKFLITLSNDTFPSSFVTAYHLCRSIEVYGHTPVRSPTCVIYFSISGDP